MDQAIRRVGRRSVCGSGAGHGQVAKWISASSRGSGYSKLGRRSAPWMDQAVASVGVRGSNSENMSVNEAVGTV